MPANCSEPQYGIPVLYELGHLQNYFHSCYHNFMTHIVGGHGLCREFQTSPSASDLISPESMFKRDAAPHLIDSDAHVVLFVDSSDREDSVSQLVSQLLPGTRLTVLSCQSHCEQVLEGTTSQQSHGITTLGFCFGCIGFIFHHYVHTPLQFPYRLALVSCLVQSGCLGEKKKPLPATCFDSFVQLDSRHIVDGLDLSGTCIEFEGTLAGRTVRILLDSGASANFIDDKLVHELALPTESMSSHVTVRVADDRTSMRRNVSSPGTPLRKNKQQIKPETPEDAPIPSVEKNADIQGVEKLRGLPQGLHEVTDQSHYRLGIPFRTRVSFQQRFE
eukprot:jgi/Botrbrau1/20907/Bobra.0135s0038.1